jgi:hypothetical protein
MAEELINIHSFFLSRLNSRYQLRQIALKYPLPERPRRTLGIIKMDGAVYESDKLLRVMVLTSSFLVSSRCSRSIFLGPRPEFYLPIFSSETILMGAKRAFLVDIHPTVRSERWESLGVEKRMLEIKGRYQELFSEPLTLTGKINDIMSRAHCYVQVPPERDALALGLFSEYLDVYLDMVDRAAPAAEEDRKKAAADFENYHQTVINHDPAVKLYSILFGKQGALERVDDLFFAR